MSRRQLVLIVASAAAALVALLAAILASRDATPGIATPPAGPYRGSTLPAKIPLPDFSLSDQNGQRVTAQELRGRVIVLTFLDTDCHESCPIIANVIGAAMPKLSRRERTHVTAVALTVNPAADTPAKIRRFLHQHHAVGQLDFVIGSTQRLEPVWRAFKILSAVESGDADIHSAAVRNYNPHSIWVSSLHVGVDLTPANLVHDIRVALRG